jgi:hypothetical protein
MLIMQMLMPARAATITGSFIVYGTAQPGAPDTTSIRFVNNTPLFGPNEFGDFTKVGVEVNNGGFLDLSWRNLGTDLYLPALTTGSNLACGVSCLFSFGNSENGVGGWLNVLTVDQVALPPSPGIADVIVHGTGVMSLIGLPGYDPTFGAWSMSMHPNENSPTGWTQSFGYTASPLTPVPLPAAVWLFGSALLGLGILGRQKELWAKVGDGMKG